MHVVKKVLIAIGVIVFLNFLMVGVNILQKGGGYRGDSIEKILGVTAGKATPEQIRKLSKPQIMQLFYAASTPKIARIEGEYKAEQLEVGIGATMAKIYTDHFLGDGRWIGKAFSGRRGYGYNLFAYHDKNGKENIHRSRKMDISITNSRIDGKPVMLIDYHKYNGGIVRSLRDELRMVNDRIYIGMGYMGITGGSINPAPFLLYGNPEQWIGEDEDKTSNGN